MLAQYSRDCHSILFVLPVSDLSADRLVMAKELGADFPLTVKRGDGPEELAKRVEGLLGAQPHITIECTGVESSVQTAIYVSTATRVILEPMKILYCEMLQFSLIKKQTNYWNQDKELMLVQDGGNVGA